MFNTFHPTWGIHAQSCLVDAILEEKPYPVRMLVVQSGNPAVTMADAGRVKKAFEKLAFVVVIDCVVTAGPTGGLSLSWGGALVLQRNFPGKPLKRPLMIT